MHIGVDYSTKKISAARLSGDGRLLDLGSYVIRKRQPQAESHRELMMWFAEFYGDPSFRKGTVETLYVESPLMHHGDTQTALGMAMVVGGIMAEFWMHEGLPEVFTIVQPATWKKQVCGNGRLDKQQVAEWLGSNHPDIAAKCGSDDEVDAVCIAMCGAKQAVADAQG